MTQCGEKDVKKGIGAAHSNSKNGVLRCPRCRAEINPPQDCPKCHLKWESWANLFSLIPKEEGQKEMEEVIDTSQIYFDLSEDEDEYEEIGNFLYKK